MPPKKTQSVAAGQPQFGGDECTKAPSHDPSVNYADYNEVDYLVNIRQRGCSMLPLCLFNIRQRGCILPQSRADWTAGENLSSLEVMLRYKYPRIQTQQEYQAMITIQLLRVKMHSFDAFARWRAFARCHLACTFPIIDNHFTHQTRTENPLNTTPMRLCTWREPPSHHISHYSSRSNSSEETPSITCNYTGSHETEFAEPDIHNTPTGARASSPVSIVHLRDLPYCGEGEDLNDPNLLPPTISGSPGSPAVESQAWNNAPKAKLEVCHPCDFILTALKKCCSSHGLRTTPSNKPQNTHP